MLFFLWKPNYLQREKLWASSKLVIFLVTSVHIFYIVQVGYQHCSINAKCYMSPFYPSLLSTKVMSLKKQTNKKTLCARNTLYIPHPTATMEMDIVGIKHLEFIKNKGRGTGTSASLTSCRLHSRYPSGKIAKAFYFDLYSSLVSIF